MKRKRSLLIVILLTFLTIFVGLWTTSVQADQIENDEFIEQNLIEEKIRAYFDSRYRSRTKGELEDFGWLIDDSPQGKDFMRSETAKLEIELHHAYIHRLRYVEYDYFLEFIDISFDSELQTAIVSVIEGHDVEFEVTRGISKDKSIVSSMRNLDHIFVLRKDGSNWKIVSDSYEDYLWRLITETGLTKEEYMIWANALPIEDEGYLDLTYSCNLQGDSTTYAYDRDGAVDYAHEWALSRNEDYHDFGDLDCTNFISQAIYEGGGAIMTSDDRPTYGWYYNSASDYASAWTHVYYFYDFVKHPGYLSWDAGPEGCEVAKDDALYGDVIQYDWQNDQYWDHGVLIVDSIDPGWGDMFHLVASHSPDLDNYPFTHFLDEHPKMVYRFIRIERLDGSRSYLALVSNNWTGAQMQVPMIDPYPTLLDSGSSVTPLPYPSPSSSMNQNPGPYPVP